MSTITDVAVDETVNLRDKRLHLLNAATQVATFLPATVISVALYGPDGAQILVDDDDTSPDEVTAWLGTEPELDEYVTVEGVHRAWHVWRATDEVRVIMLIDDEDGGL